MARVSAMKALRTALLALAVVVLAGCSGASSDASDAPPPAEPVAAAPAPPDVVDLRLDEARELLDGFEVVEVDASGEDRGVWSPANWIVIAQSVDGDVVTLDIVNERDAAEAEEAAERDAAEAEQAAELDAAEAEREALEAATNGVSESDAKSACRNAAEAEFIYGVDYHSIMGVLNVEHSADAQEWFIKVEATVNNASGAEFSLMTECTVSTATGSPVVVGFLY